MKSIHFNGLYLGPLNSGRTVVNSAQLADIRPDPMDPGHMPNFQHLQPALFCQAVIGLLKAPSLGIPLIAYFGILLWPSMVVATTTPQAIVSGVSSGVTQANLLASFSTK
jgi:hypothetical protein